MLDRTGYLNGVLRDLTPPRKWRPPSPTSVPDQLAPDGHRLELERTVEYASDHGTRMPAFDRHVGACQCGHVIDDQTLGPVYGPPTAPSIVAAWVRHLAADEILDRDELVELRRALTDAEHTARYGRPYYAPRSPA